MEIVHLKKNTFYRNQWSSTVHLHSLIQAGFHLASTKNEESHSRDPRFLWLEYLTLFIRLYNLHTIGQLVSLNQILIRNFPICIVNIIKAQFGLFLFSKTQKTSFSKCKGRKLYKMASYREDFVRFESKLWVSRQNRETW